MIGATPGTPVHMHGQGVGGGAWVVLAADARPGNRHAQQRKRCDRPRRGIRSNGERKAGTAAFPGALPHPLWPQLTSLLLRGNAPFQRPDALGRGLSVAVCHAGTAQGGWRAGDGHGTTGDVQRSWGGAPCSGPLRWRHCPLAGGWTTVGVRLLFGCHWWERGCA